MDTKLNIILAISGSISCYKSYDLARNLVKDGHQVKIILTQGAVKFIRPQTFRYLGVKAVYTFDDDFHYPKDEKDDPVLHISLARWAHKLVIAPLSANTASRLAKGEANDLLTSLFLAFDPHKNILIFPAMNSHMLEHPFTKENLNELKKISSLGNVFIHPTDEGLLACEETGEGKLADIEEIKALIETITPIKNPKRILIASGATISPIDPVRYVTNPSSGTTGYYLAKAFLAHGYKTHVVSGKIGVDKFNLFKHHPNFNLITVTTTHEMYQAIDRAFDQCHIYVSPAAISDLEFDMYKHKIKKKDLDHHIKFKKSPDILGSMINKKKNQTIIGFAAETDLSEEVLKEKFDRKPVDLLVGTQVFYDDNKTEGFQSNQAVYKFFDGKSYINKTMEKRLLADYIVSFVQQT